MCDARHAPQSLNQQCYLCTHDVRGWRPSRAKPVQPRATNLPVRSITWSDAGFTSVGGCEPETCCPLEVACGTAYGMAPLLLPFPLQNCRHWAAGQRRTFAQFWKHALLPCACTVLPPSRCSTAVPPSVMAPAKTRMLRRVFMNPLRSTPNWPGTRPSGNVRSSHCTAFRVSPR